MTRRIFVDPGSNVTGWALFHDDEFIQSGTIRAKAKKKGMTGAATALVRLKEIYKLYHTLFGDLLPDEVLMERMNYKVHYFCQWANAVIGLAAAMHDIPAQDEISPSSWKAYERRQVALAAIRETTESEDEAVAVLLGFTYLEKLKEKAVA